MKFKKHNLLVGIEFDKKVLKEFGISESKNKGKYYCMNCNQYFKTKPKTVCEAKIETKTKMGKHSRAAGKRFEIKVREDLEKNGWIVFKNTNDVKFEEFATPDNKYGGVGRHGKFVACKPKFNPFTHSLMMNSGGFPDFICMRKTTCGNCIAHGFGPCGFEVMLVESKLNGVLDKAEKEKIDWIKSVLKISVVIASYDYPEENINVPPEKRKKKAVIYNGA